jgi:hypothetical protein
MIFPGHLSLVWFLNHPKCDARQMNFWKVSLSVSEFKLAIVKDFDEINVFSHLMLMERMTLVNHFYVYLRTCEV